MGSKLLQGSQDHGMRLVAGRVDVAASTPSAAKGEGFSVVDAGAGQVQIVFDMPGKQILSACASAIEGTAATAHSVKVLSKTEASDVTFGVYVHDATDGALVDNVAFYFQVWLSDLN
jgi:hypothetical protein